MEVTDVKVSDLRPGDCFIRKTSAYKVIKISKIGNHCSVVCKSMKNSIKFMYQIYDHEVVEKTEVCEQKFHVVNTDISDVSNEDGSYDVSFDAFDENYDNPTTFILELDNNELNDIRRKKSENKTYKMDIVSFMIKENDEYRVFVKLNI